SGFDLLGVPPPTIRRMTSSSGTVSHCGEITESVIARHRLSLPPKAPSPHQHPPQPPTPASTHPARPAPVPVPPSPHPPTHSAPAGWPHPHCHCPSARKYPASRPCARQSTGG